MIRSRVRPALSAALAVAAAFALQTLPGRSEDQPPPPEAAQPAPAANPGASDQAPDPGAAAAPADSGGSADAPAAPSDNSATAPAAEPSTDGATAPSPAPTEGTDTSAPPPADDSAHVAPVEPEAPAAATESATPAPADAAPAVSVEASELKIGTAVFGADGAKIGEVNGVKSDGAGKVQEILVTDGMAAGIDAKVFAVSADKITSVSDGVKLSLSSDEAKKLPIIGNNG